MAKSPTLKTPKSIGILLFDEVELLDFAGPLQVFSAAQSLKEGVLPKIEVIAKTKSINVSKSGLKVVVDKLLEEVKEYDIFVIPGGMGTRPIIKDLPLLQEIDRIVQASQVNCTVCTGSLVLAKLGHLKNLSATTHFAAVDMLTKLDPTIVVDRTKRVIDHGDFVISEGVSAGIDMSFHLLTKYFGKSFSNLVRKYLEYYPMKYEEA